MVFFTCNTCGASLKKNQVEKHYQNECRRCEVLSCMDCGRDFHGDEYVSHTKCISEAEKYQGSTYKESVSTGKGERKQQEWLSRVKESLKSGTKVTPRIAGLLERVATYTNIPRKKAKFENFVRNSINVRDQKTLTELWEVFSSFNQQSQSSAVSSSDEKLSQPEENGDLDQHNDRNTEQENERVDTSEKADIYKEPSDEEEKEPRSLDSSTKELDGESSEKKKKKKNKKRKREVENAQGEQETPSPTQVEDMVHVYEPELSPKKKGEKKKRKRTKNNETAEMDCSKNNEIENEEEIRDEKEEEEMEDQKEPKKRKSNCHDTHMQEEKLSQGCEKADDVKKSSKKKKKKKSKKAEDVAPAVVRELDMEEEEVREGLRPMEVALRYINGVHSDNREKNEEEEVKEGCVEEMKGEKEGEEGRGGGKRKKRKRRKQEEEGEEGGRENEKVKKKKKKDYNNSAALTEPDACSSGSMVQSNGSSTLLKEKLEKKGKKHKKQTL